MHQNHAAIDVGSNTLRLLIASVEDGKIIRKASGRVAARLGSRISETGALDAGSIAKAIDALQMFKKNMSSFHVQTISAVGTYALRTASNSQDFISLAKKQAGIDIRVISGEDEAGLTLAGITAGCPALVQPYVLIDIGGGSTEWISMKGCIHETSIPTGAVKLNDMFFESDPATNDEMSAARSYVHNLFAQEASSMQSGETQLVATGGTATTLASIDMSLDEYDPEKVHGHLLSAHTIDQMINKLSGLLLHKRAETRGLEHDRADIIVPGAIILSEIMKTLQTSSAIVSDYGLLEALIIKSALDEKI